MPVVFVPPAPPALSLPPVPDRAPRAESSPAGAEAPRGARFLAPRPGPPPAPIAVRPYRVDLGYACARHGFEDEVVQILKTTAEYVITDVRNTYYAGLHDREGDEPRMDNRHDIAHKPYPPHTRRIPVYHLLCRGRSDRTGALEEPREIRAVLMDCGARGIVFEECAPACAAH